MKKNNPEIETFLRDHFEQQRPLARPEHFEALLQALRNTPIPVRQIDLVVTLGFLAEQARWIRLRIFLLQLLVATLIIIAVQATHSPDTVQNLLSTAGAVIALLGVIELPRSYATGLSELEAVCPFNDASAAFGKLIVTGFTSSLFLFVTTVICSFLEPTPFIVLIAMSFTPYFALTAGALTISRLCPRDAVITSTFAWGAFVFALCILTAEVLPLTFSMLSAGVWVCAVTLSVFWLARELFSWLSQATSKAPLQIPGLPEIRLQLHS
ncbi:hypothetical protein [Schaalia vaccimaxillae]|uniref:hypothetical protein n=1 Tax=Schaalia vaccimaxillae TaxID=183916 RepID=UPI0003B40F80|nr:hypothetical protein [Schaalia vaccimaxillae]